MAVEPTRTDPLRVLVTDDEPLLREVMARFLRNAGMEVCEAEDGERAMRLLGTHRVDVVVVDIFMPNKDGIEVIRHIRKSGSDVFVIAISGGSLDDELDYQSIAQKLGADATLAKPFALQSLIETIRSVVARGHRQQREGNA